MKLPYILESVINFFFILLELLIGFRFLFKVLGADQDSAFVSWVYNNSTVFIEPFSFIDYEIKLAGDMLIELKSAAALASYALVNILIIFLLRKVFRKG